MDAPHDRRDDWRSGVDEALVGLNTAQRVTDNLLDDLELKYEAIDHLLRGDPSQDTDGIISRLHRIEDMVQEIKAVMVKTKMAEVEITKSKWEFSGRVIERILIIGAMLLLGWDKIVPLYKKVMRHELTPFEQMIERAKHPKGKKHYQIRIVPPKDEEPQE